MTQKGPRGERNCKKNRVTGRAGGTKRERFESFCFGARYLIREPGETERDGNTYGERDGQRQKRLKPKRHPGTEEFFFSFHQAFKRFFFIAHFPDCKTLSIGQPFEVTKKTQLRNRHRLIW